MKVLVFAHTPPPHHGQSYMVQLMLDGFGGDQRQKGRTFQTNYCGPDLSTLNPTSAGDYGIACYHVNARLSTNHEDIGAVRPGKFFLLFGYCLQAIWCRFRYGINTFYYVPAPGKKAALYRDWLVMRLCRPFFRTVILHWHAIGLAKWLETVAQMPTRSVTYSQMKNVDLSIVLSKHNRADAEKLFSKQIQVVSNGIPDPCPDFEHAVLPLRTALLTARKRIQNGGTPNAEATGRAGDEPCVVQVLFLAHCTVAKGLFDALKGVSLANERLAATNSPFSLRLLVAGNFFEQAERAEFDRIVSNPSGQRTVRYLGFVSGDQKRQLLKKADILCFPTHHENQPVSVIEAMAFGLPIVTTRLPSVQELFPPGYCELVDIRAPNQIAEALLAVMSKAPFELLRHHFVNHFAVERHLAGLAAAFHSVESTYRTQTSVGPAPLASQHSQAS